MTDMETTFLRTAITEVLPDLPEVTKYILEETLQSLGVEAYDNFKFIQESDLLSALRPIQAWKVLAAWRCKSFIAEQNATTSPSSRPNRKVLNIKTFRLCYWPFFLCVFAGQTPERSSSSVSASPEPPTTLQHLSPGSSQSSYSSSSQSSDIDWVDTFLIPWDKCINWDVKFLPLGETPESQQEKKEKLKMMSRNWCKSRGGQTSNEFDFLHTV